MNLKRITRNLRREAQALSVQGDLLMNTAQTLEKIAIALGSGTSPAIGTFEIVFPIAYSQNDPRWKNQVYAGDTTFASAGCYVACVSMLATWGGSIDTPPQTAAKMREAKCFNGNMLSNPQNIPDAYPSLEWPDGAYWNRTGDKVPGGTMMAIKDKITQQGPLILKVDYKPENYKFNMHFVLATSLINNDDLEIIDPLDGKRVSLLSRYGKACGWTIEQAIFGYRGLRVRM